MQRTRSFRRAQEKRALHKAFRIVREWYPPESFHRSGFYGVTRKIFTQEDRWDMARHMASNRKPCSCCSCRNRRRDTWMNNLDRLTMQERKALLSAQNQLEDMPR